MQKHIELPVGTVLSLCSNFAGIGVEIKIIWKNRLNTGGNMDIKFELSFTEAMQAVLDGKFVQGRTFCLERLSCCKRWNCDD